jgi:hypothetical protein
MNKNKNNILDNSMTKLANFFILNFINAHSKICTINVQTLNKMELQFYKVEFSIVTKNTLLGK